MTVKQYRGMSTEFGQLVAVETGHKRRGLDPRYDVIIYTRDGFAWGQFGPGAAQLALALVADATGDVVFARLVASDLVVRMVATLPVDGWVLSEREVLEAVRDLER